MAKLVWSSATAGRRSTASLEILASGVDVVRAPISNDARPLADGERPRATQTYAATLRLRPITRLHLSGEAKTP